TPTSTVIPSSAVLNPAASTRTTYSPGFSAPETYAPASLTTGVATWPVALLVIVTFAPVTAPPFASTIVPWMLPVDVVACAYAGAAFKKVTAVRKIAKNKKGRDLRVGTQFMLPPYRCGC